MQDLRGTQPTLGGFAQVDAAAPEEFVERLDAMHAQQAFQLYKQETFDLLGLRASAKVADIGCGTGEDVAALAARIGSGGHATGFDPSEAMLEQATHRHAALSNVTFASSVAASIAASDGAFDGVRADRVLTHVPSTIAAMREMCRVTAVGGRVVISEPDMPGCWMTSRDYDMTAIIMKTIAASCMAPYAARDLYGLFRDMGLADISLTTRAMTMFDPVAAERILRIQAVVEGLVLKGAISAEQAAHWATAFREDCRSGRFACGVTIFIVAGTRPA